MDLRRINKRELGELVGVSQSTLRKHLYYGDSGTLLKGLPAPATRGGSGGKGGRVLWVMQDVLDWLQAQRTFKPSDHTAPENRPDAPPKRGRGRPRKSAPGGAKK